MWNIVYCLVNFLHHDESNSSSYLYRHCSKKLTYMNSFYLCNNPVKSYYHPPILLMRNWGPERLSNFTQGHTVIESVAELGFKPKQPGSPECMISNYLLPSLIWSLKTIQRRDACIPSCIYLFCRSESICYKLDPLRRDPKAKIAIPYPCTVV